MLLRAQPVDIHSSRTYLFSTTGVHKIGKDWFSQQLTQRKVFFISWLSCCAVSYDQPANLLRPSSNRGTLSTVQWPGNLCIHFQLAILQFILPPPGHGTFFHPEASSWTLSTKRDLNGRAATRSGVVGLRAAHFCRVFGSVTFQTPS